MKDNMNEEIKLRDFFAAQLMSGKVNDFYSLAHREKVIKESDEEWVQVSAEEATRRRIEKAAKFAYIIADALLEARK
jgi:hypothetical protein